MDIAIRRGGGRSRPGLEGLEPRTLLSGSGSLDASFGAGTGSSTLPLGVPAFSVAAQYTTRAESVATAPDGKVVVSGTLTTLVGSTQTSVLSVARFNADGSVDTTFGYGGQTQLPINANQNFSMAVQSNGQVVEVSQSFDGGGNPTYLAVRLNTDGTLDTSFGTDGIAEYPASTTTPAADRLGKVGAVVIQPDGKLVLVGSTVQSAQVGDFAAVRLNLDGSLDTSYGQAGTALAPVTANGDTLDTTYAAAIQANGQVVILGTAFTGSVFLGFDVPVNTANIAVVRLDADGSVDTTFGTSGSVLLPPDPSAPTALAVDDPRGIAIDPTDQEIVLAGYTADASNTAVNGNTVYRLDTDGTLDATFGTDGRVMPSFSATGPNPLLIANTDVSSDGSLAVQPNGQVVVLLENFDEPDDNPLDNPASSRSATALARLDVDGSTDPTFGATPSTTFYQPGLKSLTGTVVVAVQPGDGNILLAGSGTVPSLAGRVEGFTVARLLDASSTGPSATLLPPTAPASIDGSSLTDLAVYLPASGDYAYRPTLDYIQQASGNLDQFVQLGTSGAGQSIPAAADYLGIGQDQLAVYLPASGLYAIQGYNGSAGTLLQFGMAGAGNSIPVPADYDGTGVADLAVYMPSIAAFAIESSNGTGGRIVPFGTAGAGQSIPAPADYYGTGQADVAVYLAAQGAFAVQDPTGQTSGEVVPFGMPGVGKSIPVPGDYDGSGHTEFAVYIPSLGAFFYRPYGTNGSADVEVAIGTPGVGELPAVGDYDGSGHDEFAVYDPTRGFFAYQPAGGGADVIQFFGSANGGSVPVATPAGALPEFAGSSSGGGGTGNAFRPGLATGGTSGSGSTASITVTKASALPSGPTLASVRVARTLVNQGVADQSKFAS